MNPAKQNTLLTDAFGALVVRVAGIALMFVSTTVTARLLGPAEYGTYSAALALAVLLASLAPLGADRLLVRNLSITQCPDQAGRETAVAHLSTGIAGAVLLGIALTAWILCSLVFDEPDWARTLLLGTVMFVPLTAILLRQWLAIPLIGGRRAVMPEQTFMPVIFTTSLVLMSVAGWNIGAETGAATYAIVMTLVGIGSLRTGPIRTVYQSAWNAMPNISRTEIRRQFCDGLPFVGVGIGSLLSQSSLPLLIAATCGFRETACFALAFPYAVLVTVPLCVFNVTMIPRCARHYKLGEFTAANHAVRSAATVTGLLAVALSLVIWIGSPLLATLLGSEFGVVSRLLPPLLLAAIVDCFTGPTIPVMQTMQLEKTYARALFAFIPVLLSLVYWLGSVASVEGAACAYLVSRCLWNVIVVVVIYRHRGLLMLPYLSVSQAFDERPAALDSEIPDPGIRGRWNCGRMAQLTTVQTRAA